MRLDYTEIMDRMKKGGRLKNDSAVARVLGVTPQALSNYKKRGKMPTNLIIKFASLYGFSVDWLLTGSGEVYREDSNPEYAVAREECEPYAGAPYESGGEKCLELAPLSPDEIIYVGKLLKVFRNSNISTTTAIKCSINAFLKSASSCKQPRTQEPEPCVEMGEPVI